VGPEGQERIGRACADVGLDGFAAEVAARYLAGAGVARLRVRDAVLGRGAVALDPGVGVDVEPALPAAPAEAIDLRHPVARDLARGAMHALAVLRGALDRGGEGKGS
jgi:hypothetical protein